MSYLDILNETRQNMAAANPFENIMRGAQGFNQIQNQLLQNQQAQQTLEQNAAMNPLLMQSRQAELQGLQTRNQAAQMEIDDFQKKERLGQLYRASQALKPFIEKGDMQGAAVAASRFSEYGLPQDVTSHVQGLLQSGDLESITNGIRTIESLARDMDSEKTAEQKNRAALLRTIQPALDEDGNFDPSKANAEQKAAAGALGIYRTASKMTKDELEYTDQEFADFNTAKEVYRSARTAEEKEKAISRIQLKYGPEIAQEVARGTAQGKGEEVRGQDLIDRGITAAESLATTKRALSLLNTIETGGIDKVQLAAKQYFGVESADEGELTYNLAKSVLQQLKTTFGSQFTDAEGQRLERIEASIGRGTESNKRILAQLQRMSERTAKRALRAAEDRGDFEAADDIREMMDFSLEIDEQPAPRATSGANTGAPKRLRFDAQGKLIP